MIETMSMKGAVGNSLRILLLDTKSSNPNHYLCLAVDEALRRNPQVEEVYCCNYSNAISVALEKGANFFLAFDGEDPDLNICARLAAVCGRSAIWYTEDPYELEVNVINSKIFDIVFTNDKNSIARYSEERGAGQEHGHGRQPKVYHLPLAAAEFLHFHQSSEDDQKDFLYDLLFVGTAWPNRVEFLSRLLPMLPDIKYKIALPTNSHLPKFTLPMPIFEYNWKTSNFEFSKMASRSRVVLSLHRDYAIGGDCSIASTPGPRLFEVALAGGFQLISSELDEVTQYYDSDGHEMVTFSGLEDCAEKIKYFLKNPEERMAIAKRGQNKTLDRHLYRHRVCEIIEKLDLLPQKLNSGIAVKSTSEAANKPIPACLSKKNLLFVTHNTIKSEVFGGVEVYQDRLAKAVAATYNVFYLAPTFVDSNYLSSGLILFDSNYAVIEKTIFLTEDNLNPYRSDQRELNFKKVLVNYNIELVHFQHLVGHCLSLPLIAKQLGVPSVMSFHDYYFACENLNLINNQQKYCRADRNNLSICDSCLGPTRAKVAGTQALRRSFCDQVLNSVDLMLFNTPGVRDVFASFFREKPLLPKCSVRAPSIMERQQIDIREKKYISGQMLRVVSLGNFLQSKGSEAQFAIFEMCRDLPIEFSILGNISEPDINRIESQKLKNVIVRGHFSQSDLYNELQKMDVSLHLSIWPETYCLTLSEAWQSGLIPLVTDIGALGERVQDRVNGFKIPVNDSTSVVKVFKEILDTPELLERMRTNLAPELWQTAHDAQIMSDYSSLILKSRRKEGSVSEQFESAYPHYPVTKVGQVSAVLSLRSSVVLKKDFICWMKEQGQGLAVVLRRLFFHLKYNGPKKTAVKILKRLKNA